MTFYSIEINLLLCMHTAETYAQSHSLNTLFRRSNEKNAQAQ